MSLLDELMARELRVSSSETSVPLPEVDGRTRLAVLLDHWTKSFEGIPVEDTRNYSLPVVLAAFVLGSNLNKAFVLRALNERDIYGSVVRVGYASSLMLNPLIAFDQPSCLQQAVCDILPSIIRDVAPQGFIDFQPQNIEEGVLSHYLLPSFAARLAVDEIVKGLKGFGDCVGRIRSINDLSPLYLIADLSCGADNESELHELCSDGRIPLSVLVDYAFLGSVNVSLEQVINYHVALKMRASLANEVRSKAVDLNHGIVNYGRLADSLVKALAEEGVFVVHNVYHKQQFDQFAVDLERIVMNGGYMIDSRERAVKGDYVVTVCKSNKYSCGVSASVIPINSVGMVIEVPFNDLNYVVVKDLVTEHSLKLQHDEYKVLRKVSSEPSFFMFRPDDLVIYKDYRRKELIGKVKSVDVREEQCSVDFRKLGGRVVNADELTLKNSAEASFRHRVFVAKCEERKVSVRKAIAKAKGLAEKLARDYDVDAYIDLATKKLASLGVSKPVQQEFLRSCFNSVRSRINLCNDLPFEIDDLSDYVNGKALAREIDREVRRLFSTRMENIVFKTGDSDTFVKNFVHDFMNGFWVVDGPVGIGDFVESGDKVEGKSMYVVAHFCHQGIGCEAALGMVHLPGTIKASFRKKQHIDYLFRTGDSVKITGSSSEYGKSFDEGVVLDVDLPSVRVKFGDAEYSLHCYDLDRKPTLNDNDIYEYSKKSVVELLKPFAEYVLERAAVAKSERRRLCSRSILDLSSLSFVREDFKSLILNKLEYQEDVKDLFV